MIQRDEKEKITFGWNDSIVFLGNKQTGVALFAYEKDAGIHFCPSPIGRIFAMIHRPFPVIIFTYSVL